MLRVRNYLIIASLIYSILITDRAFAGAYKYDDIQDNSVSDTVNIVEKPASLQQQDVKLGTGVRPRKAVGASDIKLMQGNSSETQHINVPVNKAAILRLPRPSRDVIVANPELMDVVVRSPQELYLFAKAPGQTNAFIFDDSGQQIVNLEINIGLDVKELQRAFKQHMPKSKIQVTSMGETIILSGNVKNAQHAKIARDIARRLVNSPENVINNIGVTGQEQVLVKVKVAEMQRTILKQLGIDWNTAFQIGKIAGGFGLTNGFGANGTPATGIVGSALNTSNILSSPIGGLPAFANTSAVTTYLATLQNDVTYYQGLVETGLAQIESLQLADIENNGGVTGATQTIINSIQDDIALYTGNVQNANAEILQINNSLTNAASVQEGSPALRSRTAGFNSSNVSVDGLLRALERHSLLKTLAEPNLTALSGESAKFLAGGELPYLISQSFGQASVDFKPFGIGLAFTPIVLDENRISLKISTEISDISETVTAGESSYPGLSVRRAETTVEMPSGGTMAMAGLIRDDTRRSIDSTPGLKEVPILGPLFRSNDFRSSQSELVVLVTPYLVNPAHESDFNLPTDGYANPSDIDMYYRGHLAAVYDDQNADKDKKVTGNFFMDLIGQGQDQSQNSLDAPVTNSINNNDEFIVE